MLSNASSSYKNGKASEKLQFIHQSHSIKPINKHSRFYQSPFKLTKQAIPNNVKLDLYCNELKV